jgi:hypothetical protein
VQPRAGSDAGGFVGGSAEESVRDIVHSRAEHCAVPFNVKPPATVFIGVTTQISDRRATVRNKDKA